MAKCRRCGGNGKEPRAKRKAADGAISIAWQTCARCGVRYDEGNAQAHFFHSYGECLRPHEQPR